LYRIRQVLPTNTKKAHTPAAQFPEHREISAEQNQMKKLPAAVLCAFAIVLFSCVTTAYASSVSIPFTVPVEYQGQPASGITLYITLSDGVTHTVQSRWVETGTSGSYASTASFQCENNGANFGINASIVEPNGAFAGGGNHSESFRNCNDSTPVSLVLAAGKLGSYDRNNAGDFCPAVGKPVNVTNGNMFVRQTDYSVPGIGEPLALSRSYNSMIQESGIFGFGWVSDLEEKLLTSCRSTFDCNTSKHLYYAPDGRIYHLTQVATGIYNPISPGIQEEDHRSSRARQGVRV
jgi:hypothetical protein